MLTARLLIHDHMHRENRLRRPYVATGLHPTLKNWIKRIKNVFSQNNSYAGQRLVGLLTSRLKYRLSLRRKS